MPMHTDRPAPLPVAHAVTVEAPARLHLGFLDPSGTLGRPFGSIGLVIEDHGTRVTARRSNETRVEGASSETQRIRIEHYVERLQAALGGGPITIDVEHCPRGHSGLGSGTQMALAVGAAVMRLTGHVATSADNAERLGRGARSGIGVLGFEHGGLIVDGGPGRAPGRSGVATLPPLLSRHAFPDAWRILLIDDTTREGLHGDDERRGLAALAPFPATLAAHLCHLVLMRVLPGIAQADFSAFANGIGEIQQTIGEYFAPVQGGVFASPAVAQALNAVRDACPAGIGQTSWGPTGFAFLPDARTAERALAIARDALSDAPGVVCSIAAGRNRGAWLRAEDGEPHRQQCRAGTA